MWTVNRVPQHVGVQRKSRNIKSHCFLDMEVVFWGMEENPRRDPQVELAIEQPKLERDRISRRVGRRTCCQCNGNGSCVRCECAASRNRCTNCLPLKRNRCGNPPNADESSLPVFCRHLNRPTPGNAGIISPFDIWRRERRRNQPTPGNAGIFSPFDFWRRECWRKLF